MRVAALLFVSVLIAPGTWLRDPPLRPGAREVLRIVPVPAPRAEIARAELGPFRLAGVWKLTSPHGSFGGYSALVWLAPGNLLAVSDRGYWLRFSPPGTRAAGPRFGSVSGGRSTAKISRDIEAATIDRATATVWLAWEGSNRISRHPPGRATAAKVRPVDMRQWGANSGPEVMTRLADGRFLVLREAFGGDEREHAGLLFPRDPVAGGRPVRFVFQGAEGFSPTDAAQLPDGRVLILMRRLVWPMPFRFVGRIVVADPAEIRPGGSWRSREAARLGSLLPVDNFEGLAIAPGAGGSVTIWMISDDNNAVTQRTLLWKLALDPRELP